MRTESKGRNGEMICMNMGYIGYTLGTHSRFYCTGVTNMIIYRGLNQYGQKYNLGICERLQRRLD